MKIYTRTGDAGKTSLVGGKRVDKPSTRLEAYGTIDELNSFLGLLAAEPVIAREKATSSTLTTVQSRLFDIGAYLATDNTDNPGLQPSGLSESDVAHLECQIDIITPQLPQLKSFILPGGCHAAAHAQVCRAVCRRAERRILALAAEASVAPLVVRYINRLSDYLFTVARFANTLTSTPETPWKPS